MFFALKHVYYDSYHLGNTFKSPFYPVNPEVTVSQMPAYRTRTAEFQLSTNLSKNR